MSAERCCVCNIVADHGAMNLILYAKDGKLDLQKRPSNFRNRFVCSSCVPNSLKKAKRITKFMVVDESNCRSTKEPIIAETAFKYITGKDLRRELPHTHRILTMN